MLDKIIAFIGQASLSSFMEAYCDESYDPSRNAYKNLMVQRGLVFHVQTLLPRQPSSPMPEWPNYSLRTIIIKETTK